MNQNIIILASLSLMTLVACSESVPPIKKTEIVKNKDHDIYVTPGEFGHAEVVIMGDHKLLDTLKEKVDIPVYKINKKKMCEWVGDYGPWTVYTKDGDVKILDLIYPRSKSIFKHEDDFPSQYASQPEGKKIPVVHCPFAISGGNMAFDGNGMVVYTVKDDMTLGIEQGNSVSSSSKRTHKFKKPGIKIIRRYFKHYFNCHKSLELTPLKRDGTGHLDMFFKFLDPETVIIGEYQTKDDAAHPDNFKILNDNTKILEQTTNGVGKQLKVYRMPMPKVGVSEYWRNKGKPITYSYTNSLIVNNQIFVPAYGLKEDEIAINLYKKLCPNKEIVPMDCSDLIQRYGAVHCITKLHMADPFIIEASYTSTPLQPQKPGTLSVNVSVKSLEPLIKMHLVYWTASDPLNSFKEDFLCAENTEHVPYFENKCSITLIFSENHQKVTHFYIYGEDDRGMYETFPENAIQKNSVIKIH